jgi:biopolymer transport protein ExbB/TolQ
MEGGSWWAAATCWRQGIVTTSNSESMSPIGKRLAVCGSFLQLGIIVGLMSTGWALLRTLRSVQTDAVGPRDLAAGIAGAMTFTAIGLAISLVGIVLIALAVFVYGYRASWLFSIIWMVAVLWFITLAACGVPPLDLGG